MSESLDHLKEISKKLQDEVSGLIPDDAITGRIVEDDTTDDLNEKIEKTVSQNTAEATSELSSGKGNKTNSSKPITSKSQTSSNAQTSFDPNNEHIDGVHFQSSEDDGRHDSSSGTFDQLLAKRMTEEKNSFSGTAGAASKSIVEKTVQVAKKIYTKLFD